jgi:hypothetical protein
VWLNFGRYEPFVQNIINMEVIMCKTSSSFSVSCFRHRGAAWLLLVIFVSSFAPAVSLAQQPTATISALSGTVLVSGQTAKTGAVLHTGDTLQTQAGASAVLVLSDGSELQLGENTQVNLADLAQTATGARVSRVKMLWGRIRAKLSPGHQQAGSSFDIETPNALVGVKFSQPDVEVSYDPAKQETIGIAHTVELMVKNLLTGEIMHVPVGSTVIITAIGIKVIAGIVGAVSASSASTTTTSSTATGTASTGASTGLSAGTIVAIGAGVAAVGGVAAVVASSGNDNGSNSGNSDGIREGISTWILDEEGTTSGCVNFAPGARNGPYGPYRRVLSVEKTGDNLIGSGVCPNPDTPMSLEGTISGTNIQFRRYGPGCTPGYSIDWNYVGSIRGHHITGTFSGGSASVDFNGSECSTSGTFTVTIQ